MATAEAAVVAESGPATPWWLTLLEGISLVIIGILLFTDTDQTVFTLVLFVGIWWFITGIMDLVSLFIDRTHWGWKLFSGIIGIIAGLAIIRHPYWAAVLVPATLIWVLGIFGIFIGAMSLIRAFQGAGWGTGILGGVTILAGLALLSAGIGVAVATAIFLVAIFGVIGGIACIVWAFRVRSAA